jgi:hypothetical protein
MAFEFRKCLSGAVEQYEDVLISNVSITKGELLYAASGYATNATASSCTTQTVIGVAGETVDNSGGSAGDKDCAICVSPDAIFEVGTVGTAAQSQIWTNVDLGAITTVDEDDPKTGDSSIAGVVQLRKLISTSKVLVRINYFSTGE